MSRSRKTAVCRGACPWFSSIGEVYYTGRVVPTLVLWMSKRVQITRS